MSPLAFDIQYKAREAAALPSVEEWIRNGGQVERVEEAPRREAVMVAHRRSQGGEP